ncbi:MAG: hypothetical protein EZS28_048645, partial [Streblomastix strix]
MGSFRSKLERCSMQSQSSSSSPLSQLNVEEYKAIREQAMNVPEAERKKLLKQTFENTQFVPGKEKFVKKLERLMEYCMNKPKNQIKEKRKEGDDAQEDSEEIQNLLELNDQLNKQNGDSDENEDILTTVKQKRPRGHRNEDTKREKRRKRKQAKKRKMQKDNEASESSQSSDSETPTSAESSSDGENRKRRKFEDLPEEIRKEAERIEEKSKKGKQIGKIVRSILEDTMQTTKSKFNPTRWNSKGNLEAELEKSSWEKPKIWKTVEIPGKSIKEIGDQHSISVKAAVATQEAILNSLYAIASDEPVLGTLKQAYRVATISATAQ